MGSLDCPACGFTDLDLTAFEQMMVLRPDAALFSVRCPGCGTLVSGIRPIPSTLREDVEFAACSVNAEMGRRISGR